MTCRRVRAELNRYLDGDLSDERRRGVREHLAACVACAREWEQLRGVAAMLEGLSEVEAPARLTESVLDAVGRERIAEAPRQQALTGLALAGVGLVLSTAIVVSLAGWGPLDLSGWGAWAASLAAAGAKQVAVAAEVAGPVLNALARGRSGPLVWLLAADVAALMAVLAGARRLLSVKRLRGLTNMLAM